MLEEAHIAPLTEYVRQLRSPDVEVPYFDPLDGGINAMERDSMVKWNDESDNC